MSHRGYQLRESPTGVGTASVEDALLSSIMRDVELTTKSREIFQGLTETGSGTSAQVVVWGCYAR